MRKFIASLLVFLSLGTFSFASAVDTWHMSTNISTVETPFDLDFPATGEDHIGYFINGDSHMSWYSPTIFRTNFLDYYYSYVKGSTLSAATTTLQNQINSLNSLVSTPNVNSFITAFMANNASTTPYAASSTKNGFMSKEMFSKVNSMSTSTATGSASGYESASDKSKLDSLPKVQRIRATTDSSGAYTFTFPTAFGNIPVVSTDIENTAAGLTQVYITSVSSTSVSIQTARASNILGILTLQSAPQLTVHIVAIEP